MSNPNEHLKVVTALLAAIYDLGYEGYYDALRQDGEYLSITIRYRRKNGQEKEEDQGSQAKDDEN